MIFSSLNRFPLHVRSPSNGLNLSTREFQGSTSAGPNDQAASAVALTATTLVPIIKTRRLNIWLP